MKKKKGNKKQPSLSDHNTIKSYIAMCNDVSFKIQK